MISLEKLHKGVEEGKIKVYESGEKEEQKDFTELESLANSSKDYSISLSVGYNHDYNHPFAGRGLPMSPVISFDDHESGKHYLIQFERDMPYKEVFGLMGMVGLDYPGWKDYGLLWSELPHLGEYELVSPLGKERITTGCLSVHVKGYNRTYGISSGYGSDDEETFDDDFDMMEEVHRRYLEKSGIKYKKRTNKEFDEFLSMKIRDIEGRQRGIST